MWPFQFSQAGCVRGSVRCGFGFGSVRLSSVRFSFGSLLGSKLKKSFFKCPRASPVARDPPTVTHVPLGKCYLENGESGGGGATEGRDGSGTHMKQLLLLIS